MEYVNFNVTVPIDAYVKLDNISKHLNMTRNEIILNAIFCLLSNRGTDFKDLKNVGFYKSYN